MMKKLISILSLFFILVSSWQLNAQHGRIALVIGNSDYENGPLKNPENDARAMADILQASGFEVDLFTNLKDKDEIKKAIRLFGGKLRENKGVGLFYYAGHGVQVNGVNYLVPTTAQIYTEEEVEYECLEAGFVLAQMESADNQMNIVILDACRNNPYGRSMRSGTNGLATMNAPTGSIIAYSTAPGAVASDGTNDNGLYTEQLLQQIQTPGLKIEEVFKNVRASVLTKSDGQQIPWESSSLIGDFYFNYDQTQIRNETEDIDFDPFYSGNIAKKAENLSENRENSTGKPDTPNLSSTPRWRSNGGSYWIEVGGESIEKDTENYWDGRDLVVTHNKTGTKYILKNFNSNSDNQWRLPEVISNEHIDFNKELAVWKASNNKYSIKLNNVDITAQTRQTKVGNSLYVKHPKSRYSFILKDYFDLQDGQWRTAEIIKSPGLNEILNVSWKANNDGYWVYVNGVDISKQTTNYWRGNDLVVVHKITKKEFLLENFNHCLDGKLRQAVILK